MEVWEGPVCIDVALKWAVNCCVGRSWGAVGSGVQFRCSRECYGLVM
jgi:hypothetical protein